MVSLEVEQHAAAIEKALRSLQNAVQSARDAGLAAQVYYAHQAGYGGTERAPEVKVLVQRPNEPR